MTAAKPTKGQQAAIRAGKLTRENSCMHKHSFAQAQAEGMAKTVREQRHENVQAYPCLFCENWHIGHPSAVYHSNRK